VLGKVMKVSEFSVLKYFLVDIIILVWYIVFVVFRLSTVDDKVNIDFKSSIRVF